MLLKEPPVRKEYTPQDSGHWYLRDGSPFYSMLSKGGMERGVTLRDARTKPAVPSVTTVLQVVAKPALTNWMVDQGILAALTLAREPGEPDSDYLKRVKADSKAQAIAAADEGTRIHDAIECHFKRRSVPADYVEHAVAAVAKIGSLFPDVHDWTPEQSFAHPDGYGGKVDLFSPSTGIVIDYKTKDGDFSDGKKLAYDQHWQLAAYQHGLGLPRNVCANIFVSRTHPGAVASHVWKAEEIDYGLTYFQLALALWKHASRYDAAF